MQDERSQKQRQSVQLNYTTHILAPNMVVISSSVSFLLEQTKHDFLLLVTATCT
jgi:hypothetical protein